MSAGLSIKIVREGDEPPWGDLSSGGQQLKVADDRHLRVALIEKGTVEGNAAVAFLIDSGEEYVFTQTTLQNLIALTIAARGTFPEQFVGTPLDHSMESIESQRNYLTALQELVKLMQETSGALSVREAYETVLQMIEAMKP